MKKTLFTVMALVMVIAMIGSAFAYFTDTQTSSNNTFAAGNVYLQMSNDGVNYHHDNSVVIGSASNMAPGHSVGPFTAYFENTGSISGVVTAQVSYARDANTDAFAKKLIVTQAYSDLAGNSVAANVAGYWALQIAQTAGWSFATAEANGYVVADPNFLTDGNQVNQYLPTIYGLQTIVLGFTNGYNGPAVPIGNNGVHWSQMYLALDPSAGNSLENASLSLTVTGTLTSN